MERFQTRKRLFFPFPTLRYIFLELKSKKHSPTFDNQFERNGIRVIKIYLKQREYTFFVAFSLYAVAVVVA